MSHNKITGTYDLLNVFHGKSAALFLEVNRLSGKFPSSSTSNATGELKALRGNLFGCERVPEEDEYSEDYTCGSRNFEMSLYTFLTMIGVFILTVVILSVIVRRSLTVPTIISNLAQVFSNRQVYVMYPETVVASASDSALVLRMRRISRFSQDLSAVSRIFVLLFVFHLLTCLPLYIVKFLEYGTVDTTFTTHSYQYRWAVSIVYMKGNVPAVLLMIMWLCAVSCVVLLMCPLRKLITASDDDGTAPSNPRPQPISITLSAEVVPPTDLQSSGGVTYASIFILNAMVTGTVNGVYVYFSNQALASSTHLSIQVAVAVFKVGWNMFVVPVLAKPMKTPTKIVSIELMLLVFNNIVIPSIVTGLTSPACFQVSTPSI